VKNKTQSNFELTNLFDLTSMFYCISTTLDMVFKRVFKNYLI